MGGYSTYSTLLLFMHMYMYVCIHLLSYHSLCMIIHVRSTICPVYRLAWRSGSDRKLVWQEEKGTAAGSVECSHICGEHSRHCSALHMGSPRETLVSQSCCRAIAYVSAY